MKKICIVPARGGSKRLPRKNILNFLGQPLLNHVIEMANSSEIFEQIIVSSEDTEILNIAVKAGATIHRRPDAIATDKSTVSEVCKDVLSAFECDIFCCIYPTAVLLKKETLQSSNILFCNDSYDETKTLMGVSRYNYHPFKALVKDNKGNWYSSSNLYKQTQSYHCFAFHMEPYQNAHI